MISCLPRKATDELSAELMVAAYERKLGKFSQREITAMTDAALEGDWFPTIAECLRLIEKWTRNDEHTAARRKATLLIEAEKDARKMQALPAPGITLTQDMIDAMPPELIALGMGCGSLVMIDDKAVVA